MSPHLDDAAWSAGAVLAGMVAGGWQVEVLSVFTASVPDPSPFSVACRVDKGLPADCDYLSLRRTEDRGAAAHLGAIAWHAGLREAPDRGYPDPASLFGPLRPGDDGLVDEIVDAVGDRTASADLVIGPVGLGGHVDHRLVVEALDRLGEPGGAQLRWLDEPYRSRSHRPPPDPPDGWGWWHRTPEAASVRAHVAAGLAYASQLGLHLGGADAAEAQLHAIALAGPPMWVTPPGGAADVLGDRAADRDVVVADRRRR